MLSGLPFAIFYSFLGIPIAAWADRWSRRNVLAWPCALWSAHDGAVRHGRELRDAVRRARRARPSAKLAAARRRTRSSPTIFRSSKRGTAFSIFALAVPIGTSIGAAIGGWGNAAPRLARHVLSWSACPGVVLALLVRLTVNEPPRGYADSAPAAGRRRAPEDAAGCWRCCRFMLRRPSFRAPQPRRGPALGRLVRVGGAFNNAFFQRSHGMTAPQAGYWISHVRRDRRHRDVPRRLSWPIG